MWCCSCLFKHIRVKFCCDLEHVLPLYCFISFTEARCAFSSAGNCWCELTKQKIEMGSSLVLKSFVLKVYQEESSASGSWINDKYLNNGVFTFRKLRNSHKLLVVSINFIIIYLKFKRPTHLFLQKYNDYKNYHQHFLTYYNSDVFINFKLKSFLTSYYKFLTFKYLHS